ncbi:MAG: hypothetical protein JKY70_11150 [Mucilaginibacter sp.]|nr:hypothetical protein [Mucilaginibacter sp.]
MGNVLDKISKDNTRFTIFENDQVLTADQLNDLFNYLDAQSRLTRARSIGVGIIHGLEIGLIESKHVVVSSGTAITTDGDLLNFDYDQEFDQYAVFEDLNAQYPYFRSDAAAPIPMFELRDSRVVGAVPGSDLAGLEAATGTVFTDYAGILYLDDYNNDPDLCTGTDCDNKGVIAVKDLKVLLIHKNNLGALLQSMPAVNSDYFSLEDLNIPRVAISTDIDTFAELNSAFTTALAVKDDIKDKLTKAYQVCAPIVEQDFEAGDPTTNWNNLLDQQFNPGASLYAQYVYDYARDLSYAYTELRESLYSDDMIASPDVALFPKHVLMGLVRGANVKNPIPVAPLPDLRLPPLGVIQPIRLQPNILKLRNIRFNIGLLIKRFNPVHIDLEYRHHFYESPVLNSNNDADEVTRFCFMRIHSMITNFKIPTAADVQTVDQGLKITPSLFEDSALGERSIPFYYQYNATLPINLYWNFNANNRKRENQILSYSSDKYANGAAVLTPLKFNILKYTFFRVEGHIGFKLADVEASLNKLILDNNLPINIQSLQVEKKPETIIPRPWFFPHLYMYEKSVKSTFLDRLDDADLVNDDLVQKTNIPNFPTTGLKTAKQSVIDNARDVTDGQFNFTNFTTAVSNAVNAVTNVKAQTKQFTFSNTAIPHDFILNSEILRKTDVISGIYNDTIIKKKTGLMLGNFMKDNPGLEHAGGVLRGGTFVLVYTADDQVVVGDFMLPYASIDKDIVPNPPVYTPLPLPLPPNVTKIPQRVIDSVFEIKPIYETKFDERIKPYVLQSDIDSKVASTVNLKLTDFDQRLKDNTALFTTVFTSTKTTIPGRDIGTFGGKDLSNQLAEFRDKQIAVQNLAPDAPDRKEKETELINSANALTDQLNDPAVINDTSNTLALKGVIADLQTGTTLVQNAELKDQASTLAGRVNSINLNLRLNKF